MPFFGKQFVSMRVRFVGFVVLAGVTVVAVALLLIPLTLSVFRTAYMQPDRVDRRLEACISDFADYVAEEGVRSDDTVAVVNWTRRHRSVYLTVWGDEEYFGAAGGELWQGDERPDMEAFFNEILDEILADQSGSSIGGGATVDENGTVYAVRFANGVYPVAVVDYSLSTATDWIIIGEVILGICAFFAVIMLYYHRQTRAIVSLSREVEAISGGDLDAAIAVNRNDEIGRLAHDVDTMRNTIIIKMQEKQEAWQANSDLLTSMTHDIRTPLTTLLGYMELLEHDNANMTEEQRAYLRVCATKAEQIKGLSDKLFLYFWAYNRTEGAAENEGEVMEAALLFGQLIGDYIPAMEAEGLTVKVDLSAITPADTVLVRIDCLHRVTDNVFDNMVKYADRDRPVTITAERTDNTLSLCFRNTVAPRDTHTSSTHIGVKTCVNMMSLMKGSFETETVRGVFTARMTLPIGRQ